MNPTKKYQLVVRSKIIRGEAPNKPVDAQPSPNPNQMNRLIGYLDDGQKVCVAQRHGKGGMEFNKLLGGKVFAVAGDGMSPIFEKDKNGQATKVQKTENGLPAWSSSGFYLLSSKEYPALDLFVAYSLLLEKGEKVALITDAQLSDTEVIPLSSELDLDLLEAVFEQLLGNDRNLVARFDEGVNKRRDRGIRRAKEEAEDNEQEYAGVAYAPLAVSKKDGNPFVLLAWASTSGASGTARILREKEVILDGKVVTQYYTPEEALAVFKSSAEYAALERTLQQEEVHVAYTQGHIARTSVSFKKKVQNYLAAPVPPAYGDAVFIKAALEHWTSSIVTLMYSQHPGFPLSDYDSNHYVAACRQAEVGMDKEGTAWSKPVALTYSLEAFLMSKAREALRESLAA